MAEIGQVLGGRYRLIELLGQGGMATIYRATDTGLGRDVALKLLRPEYLRDPDFSSRFRQEAQAAASLSHPNVVTVHDYGEDPSGPFIAMELVDGEDLATILKRSGALPPRQAARIAAGVARALGAAHAKGIIHRDVKPGNVLIGRDGRVKVVDFGIARAVAEAQMTMPGTTLGSVHYFSPEQARGDATTTASDIYSLGIVLYEMLTGLRPWTGDSAASVALARLSGPVPDPVAVRSSLPPDLAAITRKALALDPDERFSSAGAMADALEASLASTAGMVGATALADAAGAAGPDADAASGPVDLRGTAAIPAAVISGTARPNPVRVPYPPDAYVGGDDEEDPYESGQRRTGAPAPAPRRSRYDEDADDDRGGTSPLVWLTGIIAIVLLAAVAFVVFQLASGANPGPDESPGVVTLPNFIGDNIEAATAEATRLGITLTPEPVQDATVVEGTIVAQDPPEGTEIRADDPVRVSVATAPGMVSVPDLSKRPEADAITLLFSLDLRPGVKTEAFDAVVPASLVSAQDPLPGTPVPPGTVVNYTISKGPEPTPTPTPSPTPTPTPDQPTPTPEPPTPTPEPPTPTPEPPTPSPEPTIEVPPVPAESAAVLATPAPS